MKVLFISNQHLDTNSGIHIFNLANHLTKLGVDCTVSVPTYKERVRSVGEPLFEIVNYSDIAVLPTLKSFEIVHAWTPREVVRRQVEMLRAGDLQRYIVHMEDNEEYIISSYTKIPFQILKLIPSPILKFILRPNLIHPQKYRKLLENANGITTVMDSLKLLCPAGIPTETIWAGFQEDLKWDRPADKTLKSELNLTETDLVITYTGNIHAANYHEVAQLYKAVELLNNRGRQVKLIRTGIDYVRFIDKNLRRIRHKYCIEMGYVSRSLLPSIISISDILIQPGKRGDFNDYRFPSKLPEYLASGKPVILPKTNIGWHLRDSEDCLHLLSGESSEIVQKVELLLTNKGLGQKIGRGGKYFAEKNLKWSTIVQRLLSFYQTTLQK